MGKRLMYSLALAAILSPAVVMAQGGGGGGGFGGGGGGGGFGGGGGGGGGFNMMDFYKQQLNATDDEWKVIQPKLQAVLDAQTAAGQGRGGRGGRGFGGGGGGGGGGAAPAPGSVQAAQAALRTAAGLPAQFGGDAGTPADDATIKAKLAALRDAKSKAETTLKAAQEDLRKVLSVRQEAILVSSNLLD